MTDNEIIKVIRAAERRESLLVRSKEHPEEDWRLLPVDTPLYFHINEYKVATHPREWWICEKTSYALPIKHGGYVHVREVLNEI